MQEERKKAPATNKVTEAFLRMAPEEAKRGNFEGNLGVSVKCVKFASISQDEPRTKCPHGESNPSFGLERADTLDT